MLLDSFQKLSEDRRKEFYMDVELILSSNKMNDYPNLVKEISEGNEHKVGVIKSLINTKISTSLTWDGCLAAVNNNI